MSRTPAIFDANNIGALLALERYNQ